MKTEVAALPKGANVEIEANCRKTFLDRRGSIDFRNVRENGCIAAWPFRSQLRLAQQTVLPVRNGPATHRYRHGDLL